MEPKSDEVFEKKKWKLERGHIKFILELILMVVVGFLVLYPFFLFFFNFMS